MKKIVNRITMVLSATALLGLSQPSAIAQNGNVGIGTTNPLEKLHVTGSVRFGDTIHFGSAEELYDGGGNTIATDDLILINRNTSNVNPHLRLQEIGNDFARLEFSNDQSTAYWNIAGQPSTVSSSGKLNFFHHTGTGGFGINAMSLAGNGFLGINTSNPTARVTINQASQTVGTGLRFIDNTANSDWDITHGFVLRFHYGGNLRGFISATTGAYTASSDERLKADVQDIGPVLQNVLSLRPVSYYYKTDDSRRKAMGWIAQEAKLLFPEFVYFSKADDLHTVDYAGFSVVAIKAIQEQQEIIETQNGKIEKLEKEMTEIKELLIKKN